MLPLPDELEPNDVEQITSKDLLLVKEHLSSTEEKSLYYLAGWAAFKLKKCVSDCDICIRAITSDCQPSIPAASLTIQKTYGGLTFPSNELFNVVKVTELVFRKSDYCTPNLIDKIITYVYGTPEAIALSAKCEQHDVTQRLLKVYLKLRMHIRAAFLTKGFQDKIHHGSKSATSRTTVL